jgi:Zn-dependent protease
MSWDPGRFDPESPVSVEPTPPLPVEPTPPPRQHWLRRLLAPVIGAGLLIWKLAAPLLIALKGIKFLGFAVSFLASVLAYSLFWGWRFGLGFVLLILVHEMGHVIQLRREGVPATAPLFIPFFGAVVGMKELPKNAWVEAKVGLAGPVLGSIGAAACFALAVEMDSDLLRAIAYTGFLINLFNLIPVLPLDGGRAAAAFHPAFWFLGVGALAYLFFLWHNPFLLLIAALGAYELFQRWEHRNSPESRAYHSLPWSQRVTVAAVYLLLIAVLVYAIDISHVTRPT